MDDPNDIRRTVLLVDDEQDVRQIAAAILSELGFHVIEAIDAQAAMAVIRGPSPVDLLMTDLAMPRIGGLELAHLAREVRPGLKVLYTSAYVRAAETNAALRYGPFIEKPWRLEQLRAVLEKLIGPAKPI